jgi:hypothetical protein
MCNSSTLLVKGLFFVDIALVMCSILDQILFSCDLILMIGRIATKMICVLEKINLYTKITVHCHVTGSLLMW